MYVEAGGVNTYYEVEGTGEPLILLHGGFATIETWAAQRRAFAQAYRVYLPERRGHGQLAVVPGTDHGLLFQKPELANRLILDFLTE